MLDVVTSNSSQISQMSGNFCSNCRALNIDCTHTTSKAKRKRLTFINMTSAPSSATTIPTRDPAAVGPVRLDRFSFAKSQISAILDESSHQIQNLDDGPISLQALTEIAEYARSLERALSDAERSTDTHFLQMGPPNSQTEPEHATQPSTNLRTMFLDTDVDELTDFVKRIELDGDSFFGHSSHVELSRMAMKIKKEYLDDETEEESRRRLFFSQGASASDVTRGGAINAPPAQQQNPDPLPQQSRQEARSTFWDIHPWQSQPRIRQSQLRFPSPSLLVSLVDLYFTKHNFFVPLLHRPTFQRGLDARLHERNRSFGELVLSVCALGARYSSDEEVFQSTVGIDPAVREHSAGWKYINQINPTQEITAKNALLIVQTICNMVPFLYTTSTPYQCWVLIGVGVRHAQAVGAHRLKLFGAKPTIQQELWKRAFWVLMSLDTYMTILSGRPPAVDPAEYDLDMPIECDDEYWEHADHEQTFKQPLGQPSKSLQYSIRTPSDLSPNDKVVQKLNSSLSDWEDNVPDHLRWDPNREDSLFLEQSALLYCAFYFAQTHLHRLFIATATKDSSKKMYSLNSYASLVVCANSARSCLHILDVFSKKRHDRLSGLPTISNSNLPDPDLSHFSPFPVANFVFAFAIMLLLNFWGAKHQGVTVDRVKDREGVLQCLGILRGYEKRHQFAGLMCDLLGSILHIPSVKPTTSNPATSENLVGHGIIMVNENGTRSTAMEMDRSRDFRHVFGPGSSSSLDSFTTRSFGDSNPYSRQSPASTSAPVETSQPINPGAPQNVASLYQDSVDDFDVSSSGLQDFMNGIEKVFENELTSFLAQPSNEWSMTEVDELLRLIIDNPNMT
ncbi:hypothetical protein D9757_003201 [Collybiopsis confluens]|uniref:Xylanolytic transcriptional activator regulatory domain-containing protein n=1 Tax=Collybiopsis confluens TaxID=2823264 RepID=A0A8H5HZ53_9AGAR|nr:hypothetical protein D9757_003201 [Collybiopsis confluens]